MWACLVWAWLAFVVLTLMFFKGVSRSNRGA
jgi:hypothetical protein